MIVLPEMFNTPFNKDNILQNQEPIDLQNEKSVTARMLSDMAKQTQKYIIGGSIPESIEEEEGKRVYNTCLCFDREGQITAKHRKIHLFDINIPGKTVSQESSHVKHGPPQFTLFETEYCKVKE